MNVIQNIKQIRLNKSITQEVLADALGVDTAVISNIEKGKRELKVKELEIIAKCLNVEVLDLFTYPKKYVDRDAIETADSSDLRATLTIELKNDKRDQVLKMIFGDDNLDLLNK